MSSSEKDGDDVGALLSKKVYSPAMLAEELSALAAAENLVSEKSIRRAISAGRLTARRLGGRNIIIFRADAEDWLNNLPSAARRKRSQAPQKPKPRRFTMSGAEIARESVQREQRRKTRQRLKNDQSDK